jgi:hypothetical protein
VTKTGIGLTIGFIAPYNQVQLSLSGLPRPYNSRPNITTTLQSLYPPQPLFWHPLSTLPWLLPNSRFPSFLSWPPTHSLTNSLTSQSQSHVATDDQSVSKSWIRAPCGSRDRILISVWHLRISYYQNIWSLDGRQRRHFLREETLSWNGFQGNIQ